MDAGDADALVQLAAAKDSVLEAVADAERATQAAVDKAARKETNTEVDFPNIGENAGAGSGSGSAKPPPPPKKKSKPKQTLRDAKIKAYVSKIKKVEKLKNEKWDPKNEQQLASKLVILDELSKKTPEERREESLLRRPMGSAKGTDVELSLRRLTEHRRQQRKEQKAKERKEKQELRDKREKDLRFAREQKAINAQIKKYHALATPPKMAKQLKLAREAVKKANAEEKKQRSTESMKSFAKEYGLNRSVEKNPDYPKIPGSKVRGSAPNAATAAGDKQTVAGKKPAASTLA